MDRDKFYSLIVNVPERHDHVAEFLNEQVGKTHKEMMRLTNKALKSCEHDEILLTFYRWYKEELKKDKSMIIVRQEPSDEAVS